MVWAGFERRLDDGANETFSDSDCFDKTVGEVVGVEVFKGVVVEVVVDVVELVAGVVVEVVDDVVIELVELVEVVDEVEVAVVVALPGHNGQSLKA